MNRQKNIQQTGQLAFPSDVQTFDYTRLPSRSPPRFPVMSSLNHQNGTATYLGVPAQKRSFGSGSTEQYFSLRGTSSMALGGQRETPFIEGGTELYRRHVLAANDSILLDEESPVGQTTSRKVSQQPLERPVFAEDGVGSMLGRGPF